MVTLLGSVVSGMVTYGYLRSLFHAHGYAWVMTDSGSLRVRRHRMHMAADRSLCRRCDARSAVVAAPAGDDAPLGPSASLARRLEVAHEADPSDAAVTQELRATLLALRGAGEAADGDLAKFWSEFRGA